MDWIYFGIRVDFPKTYVTMGLYIGILFDSKTTLFHILSYLDRNHKKREVIINVL